MNCGLFVAAVCVLDCSELYDCSQVTVVWSASVCGGYFGVCVTVLRWIGSSVAGDTMYNTTQRTNVLLIVSGCHKVAANGAICLKVAVF
jgi:riboflavin synthase alpha subunit